MPGDGLAVHDDLHLGGAGDLLDLHVLGAADAADERGNLVGLRFEHVQIGTKELDGQVALDSGNQFVDAQRNGLGERQAHPGYGGQFLLHRGHKGFLGPPGLPFVLRDAA